MEHHRKRYRLPLAIKMLLLYAAIIAVVLPTDVANVDASNKAFVPDGYVTFSLPEMTQNVNTSAAIDLEQTMAPAATTVMAESKNIPTAAAAPSPSPREKRQNIKNKPIKADSSPSVTATPNSRPTYVYWKTVKAKVTAYSPDKFSCGIYANGKTSIGKNAWQLTGVAAAPKVVPYGTMINIPGVGLRMVDDTGSAMRNSWKKQKVVHFDLRMTYPYQCRKWGVQWLDIDLYRPAKKK